MWLEQGKRQEVGTQELAAGHGEDFGFFLIKPQASVTDIRYQ